jgi:hypothetical protein
MTNYEQRRAQLHALACGLPERERRLLTAPWGTLTRQEQAEAVEIAERLGEEMGRLEAAEQLRHAGRRH